MYLSTKEHDKLRTIVMGFEIPLRTYIAKVLTSAYIDDNNFLTALNQSTLSSSASQVIRSKFGQIKSQHAHYYQLLCTSITSCEARLVPTEVSVPDVGTLVSLLQIFPCDFTNYSRCFSDYNIFIFQLEKYHYVRNKLDHPGCKTLEKNDLIQCLSFISDSCTYIGLEYEECFWDKPEKDIYQEIKALESQNIALPILINNFSNIPFSEKRIVCRDTEIEKVKTFVYGIPNALRKKSSICIYGYGGLGKTAIVTEVIKSIVQDIMDDTTVNNYKPAFILFFTAKEEYLDISQTSGEIQCNPQNHSFSSFEDLERCIYNSLGISSFIGYDKPGFIVIDNLETLDENNRNKINTFVTSMSPISIQYIITSRNEENYEERMSIEGFKDIAGIKFIDQYIKENDLDLFLSDLEKNQLLEATKGNTLVLVLSLRRLSRNIATIEGIQSDLSTVPTAKRLINEINTLPLNGYEIISEFMFKNTFDELEIIFQTHSDTLSSLLKIFAVYPTKEIDIFTICMLMNSSYADISPFINLLCRYLILEKYGESFHLNSFAEKYIIQQLLPDSFTYEKLSTKINTSIAEIKSELARLNNDLNSNSEVKNIINDWAIEYDGDQIAAAKSYHLYQDAQSNCNKNSQFHITTLYDQVLIDFEKLERTTMHPYVKYQKARILGLIERTHVLKNSLNADINKAYIDCIWAIKTNSLFQKIKSTKTYASVLWIFGSFLLDGNGKNSEDISTAIRYLEESCLCFENLSIASKEYYQCLTLLGRTYLDYYKLTNNNSYFLKSKDIGDRLYSERSNYISESHIKIFATSLNSDLHQLERQLKANK